MQSRPQYGAIINCIPVGTIHLHICRPEYLPLSSVFYNLKSCKIEQKRWKAEKTWMDEPLRTPICLTYFKVFAILLIYLIKDGSNIFFLSYHKKIRYYWEKAILKLLSSPRSSYHLFLQRRRESKYDYSFVPPI